MQSDLLTSDATVIADWRDLLAIEDADVVAANCRAFLQHLRWPNGIQCPRCDSDRVVPVHSRNQHDCRGCRYRFSITSGTVFHDSNVQLCKWLVAVGLIVESEDGFPAHRLAKAIGVTYKTAWSIGHRIRSGLAGHTFERRADVGGMVADRRLAGDYHQVSLKYLPGYLAEREWREQDSANPHAFRDAIRTLLQAPTQSAADTKR